MLVADIIRRSPRAKKLERSISGVFGQVRKTKDRQKLMQTLQKCFTARDAEDVDGLVSALDEVLKGSSNVNAIFNTKVPGGVTFNVECLGER